MAKDLRAGPADGRYDVPLEGGTATADYIRKGNTLLVTHTFVPEALRGRGAGAVLVKALLDDVRAQDLKVVPLCSFVAAYMRRHPETRDLLAKDAEEG
ncbi:MAG TPA: GNAT family N-acetyltransferase [Sphingobium sp.]|nr:GNAT family N-acetyltransferase [Sphingobium sp.]